MTTPQGLIGWNSQGYTPSPDQTTPDYTGVPAGKPVLGVVDGDGHVQIRGQVLTDEGSTRVNFVDAAELLADDWVLSAPVGTQQRVFADSVMIQRLSFPTVANERIYASKFIDYAPLVVNLLMGRAVLTTATPPLTIADAFNIQSLAGSTIQAFFGLYAYDPVANANLDPDHPTAQAEFAEWRWLASGGQLVADFLSSSHLGSGGQQTIAGATVINRNSINWRGFSWDGEQVTFRDNATSTSPLPPATTRGTLSGQIPDPYRNVFLSIGLRSGAAPGAPAAVPQLQIDSAWIRNLDRVRVDASF